MPTEMNAFYALLGVLLGGLLSVHIQLRLRKEKFKEFVYREKLAAYKEIAECLRKIVTLYVAIFEDKNKCEEMREEFFRLNDGIDKNILFVSDVIQKHLTKFRAEITLDVLKVFHENLCFDDFVQSYPGKRVIEDRFTTLVEAMRNELGVDKLSKDLIQTFKIC